MDPNFFRITIIKTAKPKTNNLNDELQWLGGSLGLFNLRDKDKSCFRLFIELLKVAKVGRVVSSDALAEYLGLSRGTVVHHLNKLMEAGIVAHVAGGYTLTSGNLTSLVDQLEAELHDMVSEMRQISREIDAKMIKDQFPSRVF